jgi:hypothetical protein
MAQVWTAETRSIIGVGLQITEFMKVMMIDLDRLITNEMTNNHSLDPKDDMNSLLIAVIPKKWTAKTIYMEWVGTREPLLPVLSARSVQMIEEVAQVATKKRLTIPSLT